MLAATTGLRAWQPRPRPRTFRSSSAVGEDPVGIGLVASLSHPGGNVTGVRLFTSELGPKRLDCPRPSPKPGLIAFVVDPDNRVNAAPDQADASGWQAVAQPLPDVECRNASEIDAAFATMARRGASAVLYGASTLFQVVSDQLITLARAAIDSQLRMARIRRGRRIDELQHKRSESGRQIGSLCRTDLEGCQTGGFTGGSVVALRVRHQPQDRQGARPHHPRRRYWPAPTR